ncbi:hypothetical protein GOBAR_AA20014 [Gossypium barbadense]|uniref:Uncharacterized protein n=1 Tax=Gossypium barbadense TaxID=3634 RepID=A0A2P5XBE9_GOSBA|nr:hypothetical protein GOBAR_AA20014 [Gossypium barbadense]
MAQQLKKASKSRTKLPFNPQTGRKDSKQNQTQTTCEDQDFRMCLNVRRSGQDLDLVSKKKEAYLRSGKTLRRTSQTGKKEGTCLGQSPRTPKQRGPERSGNIRHKTRTTFRRKELREGLPRRTRRNRTRMILSRYHLSSADSPLAVHHMSRELSELSTLKKTSYWQSPRLDTLLEEVIGAEQELGTSRNKSALTELIRRKKRRRESLQRKLFRAGIQGVDNDGTKGRQELRGEPLNRRVRNKTSVTSSPLTLGTNVVSVDVW